MRQATFCRKREELLYHAGRSESNSLCNSDEGIFRNWCNMAEEVPVFSADILDVQNQD